MALRVYGAPPTPERAYGHHRGEDRTLLPALRVEHPELGDTIDELMQDHSMLSHLLGGLRAAIMESHFRFDEREILQPPRALTLEKDIDAVLGPL